VRISGATGLRRKLARTSLHPGWAVLALAVAVAVAVDVERVPVALRYVPLAASVLVLGLPHGAVDHLALPRAKETPPTARWLVGVGVLYLVLAAGYAAAWVVAPAPAFLAFLCLTWLHWGQGDVYPLVALFPVTHLDDRLGRALTAAVRGGIPMVVPLVGFPDRYHAVATRVVGLFDPAAAASLGWLIAPATRWTFGLGLAALTLVVLGRGLVGTGPTRSFRVDVAETGLLWVYFLAVPPVLAIGLYFPLWHSLRHVCRLVAIDPDGRRALAGGDLRAGIRRFARDAAPLTAVSVIALAGLALAAPHAPASVPDLGAAYLVLLAVLTLPHVVVVTLLDRTQGVW